MVKPVSREVVFPGFKEKRKIYQSLWQVSKGSQRRNRKKWKQTSEGSFKVIKLSESIYFTILLSHIF